MSSANSSGDNPIDALAGRVGSFQDARLADLILQQGLVPPAAVRQLQERIDRGEVKGTLAEALIDYKLLDAAKVKALEASLPARELGDRPAAQPTTGGTPFGRFQLHDELGRGGMGIVFRGWQPDLGRWVAVKCLKADALVVKARFIREGRLAAQVVHPNLVPIYEVGEVDQNPYIAMALIDGGTLNIGKMPVRRALEIILQIAGAVQELHDAGIIHRDIKPGNILVDSRDRVFLGDFSLAREGEGSDLTTPGFFVGTPAFASPEQLRADTELIGRPSDVYALGATLYALITGKPPFEARDLMEVIHKARSSEPEPIKLIRPEVEDKVETLVGHAMRKDPDQRYPSAKAFAEDIQRYLNGDSLLAKPPSRGERILTFVKFHRLIVAAGSVVAIALIACAVLLIKQAAASGRVVERIELTWRAESAANEPLEWAESRCLAGFRPKPDELAAQRKELDRLLGDVASKSQAIADAVRCRFEYLLGKLDAFEGCPEDTTYVLQRARARLIRYLSRLPLPDLIVSPQGARIEWSFDRKRDPEKESVLVDVRKANLALPPSLAADVEQLTQGSEAFLTGNLERAATLLTEASGRPTTGDEALRLLAFVRMAQSEFDKSAELWKRAVERKPRRLDLRVEMAMVNAVRASRKDDPAVLDAALASFDTLVQEQPGWAKVYGWRAMARFLQGNRIPEKSPARMELLKKIAADLDKAAELDPQESEYGINRAIARFQIAQSGDPSGWRAGVEEAIAILSAQKMPEHQEDRYRMCHDLAGWRWMVAERILRQPDGTDPMPLVIAAIASFDEALKTNPSNPTNDLMYRGTAQLQLQELRFARDGRLDESLWTGAKEDLLKAVEKSPGDQRARVVTARAFLTHYKFTGEEALLKVGLEHAEKAVELDRNSMDARWTRGSICLEQGLVGTKDSDLLKRAVDDFTAVLNSHKSPEVFLDRASALGTMGLVSNDKSCFQRAFEDASEAAKLQPKNARAHYLAGTSLVKLGRRDDAIEAFKRARSCSTQERELRAVEEQLRRLEESR